MIEEIKNKCSQLKLRTFSESLEQSLEISDQRNWAPIKLINHLLQLELEQRKNNRIQRCFKQSGLYEKPNIDQFNFDHHSSRKNQCWAHQM